MTLDRFRTSAAAALVALLTGCAASDPAPPPAPPPDEAPGAPAPRAGEPAVVQPGAPGEGTRVLTRGEVADLELPEHTEADVRFMQGMILHHAQALEMTALIDGRTANRDIHLLGRRIAISQEDEIALMETWLRERGEAVRAPGGHDGHAMMAGMLSPEQMARLAAAEGERFDRLFLESMIQHHEGALTMVQQLFSSVGGGQESDIFQFASHVDADQHIEIERMRRMLASSN